MNNIVSIAFCSGACIIFSFFSGIACASDHSSPFPWATPMVIQIMPLLVRHSFSEGMSGL